MLPTGLGFGFSCGILGYLWFGVTVVGCICFGLELVWFVILIGFV